MLTLINPVFLMVLGAKRVILSFSDHTQALGLKVQGKEFRLINDDTVEGVVDDPRGYSRA